MIGDFPIDGRIGLDLTATYLSASAASTTQLPAKCGDRVRTTNCGEYVFCRADSTISTNMAVIFGYGADSAVVPGTTLATSIPLLRAIPLTTAAAAPAGVAGGTMVGAAQTSIDSARYGWIQTQGLGNINLLVACNPKTPLYTTSTAGSLDDATVSSGFVQGVFALTSATSASAPLCNFPDGMRIVLAQTSSS